MLIEKDLVHIKENKYKIPYVRKNGIKANRYLFKTKCSVCGKECFQEAASYKRENKKACSNKCLIVLKSSKDGSLKYKRGKNKKDKTQLIKLSKHQCSKKGWYPLHRHIIEKNIGRILTEVERVHHINMVQDDNFIENLYLYKNSKEHFLGHGSLNKCVKELMRSGVLKFKNGTYYT